MTKTTRFAGGGGNLIDLLQSTVEKWHNLDEYLAYIVS